MCVRHVRAIKKTLHIMISKAKPNLGEGICQFVRIHARQPATI
jgi:hypothetical protein